MLQLSPALQVPESEFEFDFVRSSGPGGQNVNKVNSKAVLHWNIVESPSLSEDARARLLSKLASKINKEGQLVLSSDRYRDQTRNREDCLEKLKGLVSGALQRVKPRKKTRPSRSSQIKAKKRKRQHSEKKKLRKAPAF